MVTVMSIFIKHTVAEPRWVYVILVVAVGLSSGALASEERSQDTLPKAEVQSAAPVPWPPQYMRSLPAHYLERLRLSLQAGTNRMGRLHIDTGKSSESIGWVRYGLPSLIRGERVDEINRFFESEKFEATSNPKFGFSLFSVSYLRLYGLLNHRSGPLKGPLSVAAQENFERQLWKVAKANSRLVEAKRDVWDMEGSENHHLSSKTSDLLVAQFLRKIPAFVQQKCDDGSTLAEQYEARRDYFLKWFDERAKRGQFVEAGSPSYQADSMNALFNLRRLRRGRVAAPQGRHVSRPGVRRDCRRDPVHDARRAEEPREGRPPV